VRLRFDYQVVNAIDQLLVSGYTVHACVNVHGKPSRIPAELRAAVGVKAKPSWKEQREASM
jgi:acyl-CoA thioesterase FadM